MIALLTIAEVAERLRVSRTTVYQLVGRGKIASHRIGTGRGAIRIAEGDLATFLEGCREQKTCTTEKPKPPTRRLRHLRF